METYVIGYSLYIIGILLGLLAPTKNQQVIKRLFKKIRIEFKD